MPNFMLDSILYIYTLLVRLLAMNGGSGCRAKHLRTYNHESLLQGDQSLLKGDLTADLTAAFSPHS
jgi:hypothetical protein